MCNCSSFLLKHIYIFETYIYIYIRRVLCSVFLAALYYWSTHICMRCVAILCILASLCYWSIYICRRCLYSKLHFVDIYVSIRCVTILCGISCTSLLKYINIVLLIGFPMYLLSIHINDVIICYCVISKGTVPKAYLALILNTTLQQTWCILNWCQYIRCIVCAFIGRN